MVGANRMSTVERVLQAWSLLEIINPWELPSLRDDLNRGALIGEPRIKSVAPLNQAERLFQMELKYPERETKKYTYYMLSYKKDELITFLRESFGNEEELINKSYAKYYSFTFDVDEQGQFLEDSLEIPQVQQIISDTYHNGAIDYANFSDNFSNRKELFSEELVVLFQEGVDPSKLEEAEQLFGKYFGCIPESEGTSYVQCQITKKSAVDYSNRFSSFYLDDLETILKHKPNETLKQFIEGTSMKVDIDENRQAIESVLRPENLPEGRWPSPVNHRLSLMQQVAVNHILQGNEQISSVNGPPGTGKTTLLKDVFAQLIVKRTQAMVKYDDPKKAFSQKGKQKIKMGVKEYGFNMYRLAPEIAKYSMVIASSNNGAVENISKELPLLEEIVRVEESVEPEDKYEIFDALYAEEAEELNFFPDYAESLLEEEKAWGLFSGTFGKGSNIQKISDSLTSKQNGNLPFLDYLKANKMPGNAWKQVVTEFNDLYQEIEIDKRTLDTYVDILSTLEQYQKELTQKVSSIRNIKEEMTSYGLKATQVSKENQLLVERIENLPPAGLFEKIIGIFTGKMDPEEKKLRKERDSLLKEELTIHRMLDDKTQQLNQLEYEEETLREEIQRLEGARTQSKYADVKLTHSTDDFWAEDNYSQRQVSVLWQTDELNYKRGLLFLKALQVHKVFLHENHQHLKVSINMLKNLRSLNLNSKETRENIGEMWKTLHLIFPIMSTTFASFSSMYRGMGSDFIDYLFIDEAGQASPQQAAGALWRSKRAIVVGDPIQIEPVVTLDETILADIREAFDLSKQYIGETASVQTLADNANPVGTIKESKEKLERIGIPLWVHRRCIEPMFSISNEIAYDNKMVLAMDKIGDSAWYDVSGNTKNKQYVPAQGEFIVEKLKEHFSEMGEDETPSVFVITPFTAVRQALISLVNKKLTDYVPHIYEWTRASIGTVHTFQGKEADIVYFVTGTDGQTDKAADWSCMKPNLLNVAVTRAKKEFYVVGDFDRFKVKQYYDVIADYLRESN